MSSSFHAQLSRLEAAGFPPNVLRDVSETLLKKIKKHSREDCEGNIRRAARPAVLPYIHRLSHNLKKVANRFGIPVVFSAPNKLSALCNRINRSSGEATATERDCKKRHVTRYRDCVTEVVYEIPLSCGRVYVGQTGRCINDRIREHSASTRQSPSGHLAVHCDRCECDPKFDETRIVGSGATKIAREILEAFTIRSRGTDVCVSAPSLSLSDREYTSLQNDRVT